MICKNILNLYLVFVFWEKVWKCDYRNGLKIMNKSNIDIVGRIFIILSILFLGYNMLWK